jgi:hypothetical protein
LWALLALDFSWSTLVLLIGGMVIYAGRLDPQATFVRGMVRLVMVFWTSHGIYMVVEPMAVPPRLAWIRALIVAFPATLILLHALALLATKRRFQSEARHLALHTSGGCDERPRRRRCCVCVNLSGRLADGGAAT